MFFASDVVFVPYKAIADSGNMFDGLGHWKSFLDSVNGLFREFSKLGLGITSKRNATGFEQWFQKFNKYCDKLKSNVDGYKRKLKWNFMTCQHFVIYKNILNIWEYRNTIIN